MFLTVGFDIAVLIARKEHTKIRALNLNKVTLRGKAGKTPSLDQAVLLHTLSSYKHTGKLG